MKPEEIESFVYRVAGRENDYRTGSTKEKRFGIKNGRFVNGGWDCNDRAELAKGIAEKYGYKAEYNTEPWKNGIGHRYIDLTAQDGTKAQILRLKDLAKKR